MESEMVTNHQEDLGVGGVIILEWILREIVSHVFYSAGSVVAPSGLVSSPPSYPPPQGSRVVTRLPLSHHSMYHVISPSSLV
jgi:hypothetical protein